MTEFIVAPTERDPQISGLASEVAMLPERFGCDIAWRARGTWWGVQRKEIKDFIASMQDGRLGKEVAQMKNLPIKVVIIEGRIKYTNDGELLLGKWQTGVSGKQFQGMIMSLMEKGVHCVYTENTRATADWIRSFAAWSEKNRHTSLDRRPGPVSPWGSATDEDWAVHLLQGFDGLGSEKARGIIAHFGRVPLRWDVTEAELMQVKGIGKILARRMINALKHQGEA